MSTTKSTVITALAAALGLGAGAAWAQSPRDEVAPRGNAPSAPSKTPGADTPTAGSPGTPSATPATPTRPGTPGAVTGGKLGTTRGKAAGKTIDRAEVDRIVGAWPAMSRKVAYLTIKKYGLPSDGGDSALVWHGNGPWKRTTVFRDPIAHQFPKPHVDVLEQVVDHRIPADKLDDLAAFDGSVTASRTAGELAVRCDKEAMNFLAINLAHEVLMGDKDADEARSQLVRDATAFMTAEQPPTSTTNLAFAPARTAAGDPGQVAMPGAPELAREGAATGTRGAVGDPAVLAAMVAINAHELEMATLVLDHSKDAELQAYARMLKAEHAKGLTDAMALGPKTDITPVIQGPVIQLQQDAAESITKLARAEGAAFEKAAIAQAIADHQKALDLIDRTLMRSVKNAEIKSSLGNLRSMVARHLDDARRLQAGGTSASR